MSDPADWPYLRDRSGRCPWCGILVQFVGATSETGGTWVDVKTWEPGTGDTLEVHTARCPACGRVVVSLTTRAKAKGYNPTHKLLYPQQSARDPVPDGVPRHIAEDYEEAALILPDSPKASAALSRRCLQVLLREKGRTNSKDLSGQIDEVLDKLPRPVAEEVDAVRHIGNFSAHATKSQSTGEIVAVEPGEAEWTLDVLDALFDHYYVQPKKRDARREKLEAKLADAGKPPMKKPAVDL